MPFLILSCAAPILPDQCEDAIRTLLSGHGEVGGILVAAREAGDAHWVAAVEMRSGMAQAIAALEGDGFHGHAVRIRRAAPLEIQGMLGQAPGPRAPGWRAGA
jgi:hypothetical protein